VAVFDAYSLRVSLRVTIKRIIKEIVTTDVGMTNVGTVKEPKYLFDPEVEKHMTKFFKVNSLQYLLLIMS